MDNEHMLLELDHISKIYGDLHAVDDLSLTVPQGQWLAIVGSARFRQTTPVNPTRLVRFRQNHADEHDRLHGYAVEGFRHA